MTKGICGRKERDGGEMKMRKMFVAFYETAGKEESKPRV